MGWRLAKSLIQLRQEVNAAFPDRPNNMDGSIGDTAHSARVSDHNPNEHGVVCAVDITEYTIAGWEMNDWLAETLRASQDPRIKYVICDGRIFSSYGKDKWEWRRYSGPNGHFKHLHVSVHGDYDNERGWNVARRGSSDRASRNRPAVRFDSEVDVAKLPLLGLRRKNDSADVLTLQALLNARYGNEVVKEDGDFGLKTERTVKAFQRLVHLDQDGLVGPNTWARLLRI